MLTIRDSSHASARARLVRISLDGADFPFEAGQAVMAGLPDAGKPKPYSIACTPAQAGRSGCIELLVGIEPDDRQAAVHLGTAPAGSPVEVSDAVGRFVVPDLIARHHVMLIAGGTGMAPIRAQLWDVLERHEPRLISLVYSARTEADICFDAEFRALHDEQRIRFLPTLTRDPSPEWTGRRGRLDAPWIAELLAGGGALCSVCGSAAFVADVTRMLGDAGVDASDILVERY